MVNSDTIASSDFTVFQANTTIKSAEHNNNFKVWRGHILPFTYDTITASNLTYDLGSSTYRWRYVFGKQVKNVVSATTTYAASISDDVILCSISGAGYTVTLPTCVGHTGKSITIILTNNAGFNALTIDGNGAEGINGDATHLLHTSDEAVTLISDGSGWQILSKYIPSSWTSYTPSWTGSVTNPTIGNGSLVGKWRREADSMRVRIGLAPGGTTTFGSGIYYFSLPSGPTIDSSKIPITAYSIIGTAFVTDVGTAGYVYGVLYNDTTTVRLHPDAGTNFWQNNSPFTFASGDYATIEFLVPITNWAG